MRSLGLYVHIPFCRSKCIYCDFYSLPHAEEQMDAYCAALAQRFAAWSERAAEYTVESVYFGGGTPSYLGSERLCALLDSIAKNYHIAKGAEITLEANPDSAREVEPLRRLRRAGFDRISLGMQSADDAELKQIGRIHTHADTVRAVAAARAAGFDDLSLDLIYGLPAQTPARWAENLAAALDLAPEHLSCYGLKVEEGTPLFAHRAAFDLPDDDAQADAYLLAVETLARHGYEQYEISNFCRAGHIARHNSRYWALGEYLGFGPGAASDFGGERFTAARDLKAFLAGREVLSERSAPSPRERKSERIMLALRTTRGLAAESLGEEARRFLASLVPHGLAVCEGGRYRLTPRGFLVSNSIIVQTLEAEGL